MLDPAGIYVYCFVGCFIWLFIVKNIIPYVIPTFKALILAPVRAIGYYFLIDRYAWIGPLTVESAFFQVIYVGGNVTSLVYGVNSVTEAASRAGTLCLINLAPLYVAPHLSFLADIFGVSLHTYQRFHRSCGIMALGHVMFHGGVTLTNRSRLKEEMATADWYPLIGAAIMILLISLSASFFRKRWYETFLRLHQLLAIAIVAFITSHLLSIEKYQWLPLYIFVVVFCLLGILYLAYFLYYNRPGSNSRFKAKYINDEIVSATITRSRIFKIKPGQYLNIWVPSISLFSTHPFTVVSSLELSTQLSPQMNVKLLIEPQSGFTRKLAHYLSNKQEINLKVLFSGPHGTSARVSEYDCVLLFATGFGITSVLPYITQLAYGSKDGRGKRFHLIWQITNHELRREVKRIIDPLFKISANLFYLSIYNETEIPQESSPRGHYTINPDKPNIASIMKNEVKYLTENSKTLVLVSANGEMRDNIRRAIRRYLSKGFKLRELDYQP